MTTEQLMIRVAGWLVFGVGALLVVWWAAAGMFSGALEDALGPPALPAPPQWLLAGWLLCSGVAMGWKLRGWWERER